MMQSKRLQLSAQFISFWSFLILMRTEITLHKSYIAYITIVMDQMDLITILDSECFFYYDLLMNIMTVFSFNEIKI